MAGDTANVWEDIYLIIDPDPFSTSCQIYSINKKARSKNPINPKSSFKRFFIDIIPSTALKSLTSDTTSSNYLLIVDAYSEISKIMVWGKQQQNKSWISSICSNLDLEK